MKDRLKTCLYGIPKTLGIVDKYFEDDKLLLAGDFFHTKTARMSAEFGIVEIPYYVAVVIEAISKVKLMAFRIFMNQVLIGSYQEK